MSPFSIFLYVSLLFLLLEFLPGHACLSLDIPKRSPSGQQKLSITPGHGLTPTATVTLEVRKFVKMCSMMMLREDSH